MVGERSQCGEGLGATGVGALGSENAGMSSVMRVRTAHAEGRRVPTEGQSASGQSGLSRSRKAQAMDNRSIFRYPVGEWDGNAVGRRSRCMEAGGKRG